MMRQTPQFVPPTVHALVQIGSALLSDEVDTKSFRARSVLGDDPYSLRPMFGAGVITERQCCPDGLRLRRRPEALDEVADVKAIYIVATNPK
jgi:hypothetical protein